MEQRIVDFTEYFGMRDTGYGIPECVCIKHNEAVYKMYENLIKATKNKTVIYISHRLSSCIFCDRIAVFDNAKLVEEGTHEQLLNSGKKYSELWNAQAQYYKV